MLSATVPNYREFADWVGTAKQKKIFVQMTEKRPVPLQHFIIYKEKLHMIKDEFNNIDRERIEKVLKEEGVDRKKNFADKDKKKAAPKDGSKVVEEEKEKDIDFKDKARKAKEHALESVTRNATKNQGAGGGSGNGPNSQRKSGNYEKFTKTVRAIQKEGLLPCVVFCFSKVQTEDIPKQLEFTDGTEKGQIKQFLKQKISRLSEEDQKLPQV